MDCCLCGPMIHLFRPPRNTICTSCFEAARSILHILCPSTPPPDASHQDLRRHRIKPNADSHKGLADAQESLKELHHALEAASMKINFLDSLFVAFKDEIHSDIELLTDDGRSIRAHRAVLAAKSSVFRTMFEVDSCKAADEGFIRISELNHKELEYLIQFMYTASLPEEALQDETIIHTLLLAADKYDIPLLMQVCESHIIRTISRANALKVLELSTFCSATQMREMAVCTILRNYESIMYSADYEEFALKNPVLALQVTKSLLQSLKRENGEANS